MRKAIQTISEPAYEPVSQEEARQWAKVDTDDTESLSILNLIVKAMREDAENLTRRAFVQRQLRMTLPGWPVYDGDAPSYGDVGFTQQGFSRVGGQICGIVIRLPYPPLVSVEAFKYIDLNGDQQTLAASQYVVHTTYEPGLIVPAWNVAWPAVRLVPNSIQIDFTAGYAPGSPEDEAGYQSVLPAKLRLWMQAKMLTIFDRRDQLVMGNVVKVPRDFTDGLLDSLIIGGRLF